MHPTFPQNVLTMSRKVDECEPLPPCSQHRLRLTALFVHSSMLHFRPPRCSGAS
jgi:hypothetical protein